MYCFIGLGNHGSNYENTRHNIGFIIVESILNQFAQNSESFKEIRKFEAEISSIASQQGKIIFAKPQTYMNNSGISAVKITQYYKIDIKNIFVIYDDVDIELGKIKIKSGGSSGGHNGIKSLDKHLGIGKYIKIRIGIGKPKEYISLANYVLGKFTQKEQKTIEILKTKISDNINLLTEYKFDSFMNKINN